MAVMRLRENDQSLPIVAGIMRWSASSSRQYRQMLALLDQNLRE